MNVKKYMLVVHEFSVRVSASGRAGFASFVALLFIPARAVAEFVAHRVVFAGLLALLFIGLKLAGAIDWSWWWVLSPLWAPWAAAGAGTLLYLGLMTLKTTWQKK